MDTPAGKAPSSVQVDPPSVEVRGVRPAIPTQLLVDPQDMSPMPATPEGMELIVQVAPPSGDTIGGPFQPATQSVVEGHETELRPATPGGGDAAAQVWPPSVER
jgi:hypothetical protein